MENKILRNESVSEKTGGCGRWKGWILAALLLLLALVPAGPARAASKAVLNRRAKNLYARKLGSLEGLEALKYGDVTGDGVVEAFVEYHPSNSGSGRTFKVVTYTGTKLKTILSVGEYGLMKVYYYKASKSLVLYGAGHGGEWYMYYTLKSGKFKLLAQRSRMAITGGGSQNGPWNYRNSASAVITKAKFNKLIKNVQKGGRKTMLM